MTSQLVPSHHDQHRIVPSDSGYQTIEGLEDLTSSDYILPRWSIIQPTSRKEGADEHVGQFQRNIDGAFAPCLDVVILKISPTRLLWSGDQSDKRPECFSRDGVTGSIYGACNQCHFNPMVNRDLIANRDANPKICGYGYTLITGQAEGEEQGALALVGAMGTSVRPIKTLNAQFQAKGRSPFSALVRIEAEKQTNDRGKYYVLKPIIRGWLTADETAAWRQRYLAIKGVTLKDVDEDVADDAPEETPNF